jgi:hypothetical protein
MPTIPARSARSGSRRKWTGDQAGVLEFFDVLIDGVSHAKLGGGCSILCCFA